MSRLLLISGLVAIFCIILLPVTTLAHVVESDRGIGAVLHIDPDDDPIAGEVSTFFFDIKDTAGGYRENNCRCRLVIKQDGQTLYDELFNRPGGGTYTFPTRGIYSVAAVGSPLSGNSFQPFNLEYTIRVERGEGIDVSSNRTAQRLPIVVGVIGAILFLFIFIRYKIVNNIK